jgi:hypothetical protein
MANFNTIGTLDRFVYLTPEQVQRLQLYGGEAFQESSSEFSICWPENLIECPASEEEEGQDDDPPVLSLFLREILLNNENAHVPGVIAAFADTCSRRLNGEFGGTVLAVTRDTYCWYSTSGFYITPDGEIKFDEPLIRRFDSPPLIVR